MNDGKTAATAKTTCDMREGETLKAGLYYSNTVRAISSNTTEEDWIQQIPDCSRFNPMELGRRRFNEDY